MLQGRSPAQIATTDGPDAAIGHPTRHCMILVAGFPSGRRAMSLAKLASSWEDANFNFE